MLGCAQFSPTNRARDRGLVGAGGGVCLRDSSCLLCINDSVIVISISLQSVRPREFSCSIYCSRRETRLKIRRTYTVTIQHKAWLQQPTYCHHTAYSMATAAHILSQYSIQQPTYCHNTAAHTLSQYNIEQPTYCHNTSYSSPHTVTIQQPTHCHNTA